MMKVIYFAEHFTTPKTGGGVRPYQMAERLLSHGHNVTMVCGGDHKLFNLSPTDKKNIYRGYTLFGENLFDGLLYARFIVDIQFDRNDTVGRFFHGAPAGTGVYGDPGFGQQAGGGGADAAAAP